MLPHRTTTISPSRCSPLFSQIRRKHQIHPGLHRLAKPAPFFSPCSNPPPYHSQSVPNHSDSLSTLEQASHYQKHHSFSPFNPQLELPFFLMEARASLLPDAEQASLCCAFLPLRTAACRSTVRRGQLPQKQNTRKSDLWLLFLHCAAAYSTSNCRSCS